MLAGRLTVLETPRLPRRRFRAPWPTILVVSDDGIARHEHAAALRAAGYAVHLADGLESATRVLRDFDPSLTLVDLGADESAEVAAAARHLDPTARVVIAAGRERSDLLRAVASARRRDENIPPAA